MSAVAIVTFGFLMLKSITGRPRTLLTRKYLYSNQEGTELKGCTTGGVFLKRIKGFRVSCKSTKCPLMDLGRLM